MRGLAKGRRGWRTVDGLATVVWVVLGLHATLATVAELANVNAIDGHFALAVVVFLLSRQTGEADILDELICSTVVSIISGSHRCKGHKVGPTWDGLAVVEGIVCFGHFVRSGGAGT